MSRRFVDAEGRRVRKKGADIDVDANPTLNLQLRGRQGRRQARRQTRRQTRAKPADKPADKPAAAGLQPRRGRPSPPRRAKAGGRAPGSFAPPSKPAPGSSTPAPKPAAPAQNRETWTNDAARQ